MTTKITSKKSLGTMAIAASLMLGAAGIGVSNGNILSITPSYAEAVKVDAPKAFSFADVVEAVSPAVVSVRVEVQAEPASQLQDRRGFDVPEFFKNFRGHRDGQRFQQRGPRSGFSQGSGFFVSEDGFLVTNHHVIENGNRFTVVLNNGDELEAILVGSDPKTDLAVLKVDEEQTFDYVEFSKGKPRIGEWVVAVGNPFGLGGTVTAGIVSAHGRDIGSSGYGDFLQIDAAVNKGNSGGPAFDLNGNVVGINTAIFSPSGGNVGIAFAVPASTAESIIADLMDDGQVVRGWLGVQIQPVTADIAESLGLEMTKGAIVSKPQSESPAEKAGIKSGDVISAVNGKAIKGPRQLAREIGNISPGSSATLDVWRNGEKQQVEVELGTLEANPRTASAKSPVQQQLMRLGMKVETAEDGDGVIVRDVTPGSRAAEKGIRPGDVITSVNNEEITNVKQLRQALKSVKKKGRKAALLQIERNDNTVFVPVPVSKG